MPRMIIYGIYPPLPSVDLWQLVSSLLPSPDDDATMCNNFATHVSCVLVNNIDFFKVTFDGVVDWHIKHQFYEQMSRKSDVVSCTVHVFWLNFRSSVHYCLLLVEVPLEILPQNENKGDEVVEIMSNLHQYVPTVKYVGDCFIPSTGVTAQVSKASLHPIIIGGDQLTAARARGAKKAKLNVDSPISRLNSSCRGLAH